MAGEGGRHFTPGACTDVRPRERDVSAPTRATAGARRRECHDYKVVTSRPEAREVGDP